MHKAVVLRLACFRPRRLRAGFTLIELVMIIAIVAVFVLLFIPNLARVKQRAREKQCVENLRQVGLSFRQWSLDGGDRYTMGVPTEHGGSRDAITNGEIFRHFQTMSNELNTPKVLICPADNRPPATDFEFTLANSNLSYFVGVDADETEPQMLLAGDRNLTNGYFASDRLLVLVSNSVASFDEALHNRIGNVGLADGSVQRFDDQSLGRALATSHTNRLQFP